MPDDDSRRPGIEFTPAVYMNAAVEHASSLELLYSEGRHCGAIYIAGVSVEALFRAYRGRIDPQFDARHNLYELAKLAKFETAVPTNAFEKYSLDLSVVLGLWSNSHRYRSPAAMRSFIKRGRLGASKAMP
jgi:hypothetical protein